MEVFEIEKLWTSNGPNGKPIYFRKGKCLSSDTKTKLGTANGSELREMDSGTDFYFDQEHNEWLPQSKGGGGGGSSPSPSSADPQMDGTASAGISAQYARGDHRHPSDMTKQNTALASAVTIAGQTYTTVEDAIRALAAAQEVDGVPIGEIVLHSGTTAPSEKYLVCDGTTANIADYPELAEFYATEYGAANYFGGDGETTFATPNLQGEFPRFSGTNAHTGQGNGSTVGTHQNATEIPGLGINNGNHLLFTNANIGNYQRGTENFSTSVNAETYVNNGGTTGQGIYLDRSWGGDSGACAYTTRPTNTSFLPCVKARV